MQDFVRNGYLRFSFKKGCTVTNVSFRVLANVAAAAVEIAIVKRFDLI